MTPGRQLRLAWSDRQGRSCLQVIGWTRDELSYLGGLDAVKLAQRLAVLPSEIVAAGVGLSDIQPIAGRFELDQESIWFVPRFPFLDGMSYSLLINPEHGGWGSVSPEAWTLQRPAREAKPTATVTAIYPTAPELPVNQLKFYVHFSRPMSEGWSSRAVSVRRGDNGHPLEGVFLSMEPELWDRERRRLTLLLDPSRIKRGLVPNLEAGYPLVEGVPIVVAISEEFRDASGQPLASGAERRYRIGPHLNARVSPQDWRYTHPVAGSMDSLVVDFDRPMDHALLEHSLWVNDGAGIPLEGSGSTDPEEKSWRFHPLSPWKDGRHLLIVDPRLEDSSGNSLIRVFDRDLTREEDTPADSRLVGIEFTCSRPSAS